MELRSCTYSLVFAPNHNIRKSIFELEEALAGYQKPFTLIPLPDDAPPEFPRITGLSTYGHSQLSVSAHNAQVMTAFSSDYAQEFDKALSYSKKKALELTGVLRRVLDTDYFFLGLTSQVIIPEATTDDPARFIADAFLKSESSLHLDDAQVKMVYTYEDLYYLNIEVKRELLPKKAVPNNPFKPNLAASERVLAVTLDFNNRYAFNSGRPSCDDDALNNIYTYTYDFLHRGIEDLITARVVHL